MVGQTISHYKILEKLGEGGMGVVYKAQDTKLDRIVALKFLPPHLTANETEKARFLQEAKSASALNHPHVCTIYRIDENNDQQFIEMEYVDGETLRKKIPIQKSDDAITLAIQAGEALAEAHGKGIVHRDIKADNIMVNSKGQVKVMDFGLAKLKGSIKLTRTSSTVGTLAYMAPEQIQGEDVDARSDIFSFGVLLFEMLTGRLPFRGEHEAAIMYSILNDEPGSLLNHRDDLSPDLERIVHRALEKDPADRYQHIDDMVSELRRLQKKSTRVVRPEPDVPTRQTQTIPVLNPPSKKSTPLIWIGIGVIAILAAIAYFLFQKPSQTVSSMAVLPFVNAGGDQSTEYLSDGFTESLINSLSKLPGIKMMSRNSVFRYKGKDTDPQAVGKELGVDAVLLGRITQSASMLNVSIELVSTADNSHLWGEQYERNPSNIITLQNEISRAVSKQLSVSLSNEDEKQITKNATENSEAYQLYLRGRFYWNKRTADGFKKAIEMFQSAIDKDPGYALAYVGLADCYALMASYFILPASEAFSKAKASANKAIELDKELAEPHTTLASVAVDYEWNFDVAEREFRRSIELNPNYATAHHWYGEFLAAIGRKDEGLKETQKAIEIDPLSPILYVSSALIYLSMGNLQSAMSDVDRALELNPKFPRALGFKAIIFAEQGKGDEALHWIHQAIKASNNAIEYRASLGHALGRFGKRRDAEQILSEILETSRKEYVAPALIALLYAGLGNNDKAFEWLERVFREHSGEMVYLKLEPGWKPLYADPRFADLTKRVGLP